MSNKQTQSKTIVMKITMQEIFLNELRQIENELTLTPDTNYPRLQELFSEKIRVEKLLSVTI